MVLTNLQIEKYLHLYNTAFEDCKTYIPAKIAFYISKNIKALNDLCDILQQTKQLIAQHYGKLNADGNYVVPSERLEEASKELEELYAVEQEIAVKTFSIEDLSTVNFTPAQMDAIIFMIEGE